MTSTGEIERPIVSDGWIRPSAVELAADGELRYRFEPPFVRIQTRSGIVDAFLRLKDAAEDEILRFARRWGPLTSIALDPITQEVSQDNPIARAIDFPETTDDWRSISGELMNVLELAAKLEDVRSETTYKSRSREHREIEKMRRQVATHINMGLFATVRPRLVWSAGVATIRLQVDGLGGALAAEILLMVARKKGLALCRACGSPFETDGRRRVYCVRCGKNAAWRAASANLYKAKKRACELFNRGVPVGEIADSVGRSIVVIRRWRESWLAGGGKDGGEKTRRK